MLESVVAQIKKFPGLRRKKGISLIMDKLKDVYDFGTTLYPPGDDAAVIRYGSEYLLLAAEEISRELLCQDPWWAGFCSVLTNVNDIYAMGGTPLAMVNTCSFKEAQQGLVIIEGIRDACKRYRVPMVGGHFSPDSESPTMSVAILGRSRKVLTSFDAQAGDDLVVAVDLQGRQYKSFLNWNCITDKTSETILERLGVMPSIVEHGWAHAGKDISNAGIIGTIGMMLEASGKGAVISIDAVPKPAGMELVTWLKMYPSYGFVLSVSPDVLATVLSLFAQRGYSASRIGSVNDTKLVTLIQGEQGEVLFNFLTESIF